MLLSRLDDISSVKGGRFWPQRVSCGGFDRASGISCHLDALGLPLSSDSAALVRCVRWPAEFYSMEMSWDEDLSMSIMVVPPTYLRVSYRVISISFLVISIILSLACFIRLSSS